MDDAETALNHEIEKIKQKPLENIELQKVKNKINATIEFSEVSILEKAMNLAYCELLGDANFINIEKKKYNKVTLKDIQRVANNIFDNNNSSTLYYFAN
jgi:predicted Zn-dependent peptidase